MAYEIISQNNTTTTLSDGTNTITVPARVTLATSTSYTISEVNNNTATLEGSDGSVIRDVPCVVVLAGEGGGGLPSQTGNAGKFLTTDGTNASWAKALENRATGSFGAIAVGYNSVASGDSSIAIGYQTSTSSAARALAIGRGSKAQGNSSVAIFGDNGTYSNAISIKGQAKGDNAIAIGANALATGAIQLGNGTYSGTLQNMTANTLCVGLGNNNYRLLDADGTIPADRLPNAINKYSIMPTAASTNVGWIVQFTGATDSTYTHGYIYECKAQGTDPETYAWEAVTVQAGGSGIQNTATGTDALTILGNPTTTYHGINIGYNSTTSGNSSGIAIGSTATASNSVVGSNGNISIGASSKSTSSYESIAIGAYAESSSNYGIALGKSANCKSTNTISIGYYANCGTNSDSAISIGYSATSSAQSAISIGYATTSSAQKAIQLGYGGTNSDANTFKVANANGNFEIMSADGTIPTDRFTTTPSADGTYVPTLTISSGTATRTWGAAASAPVVPATMPTLAVADWSSNTQTVNVTGVTASNIVFVSPAPASAADYAAAGILCTAQATDSLTFTCTTVPSNAITLSVVILG